ncbi:serine/threonine-protein phosphatase 6 regulatory ankyrin repeat subunit C-like isoform X2 [Haliotis rubra]|nr:serine/threonine-protein phosphatase 6 regulatory ankyrin repeat subunit C-like isoform X2 [Haliotis rubra]
MSAFSDVEQHDCRLVASVVNSGISEEGLHQELFGVINQECPRCVAAILKFGVPTEIRDADHFTPLAVAAKLGSAPIVEQLLQSHCYASSPSGPLGNTPLHNASADGHVDCVQCLINANADINARNTQEDTPLILAAMNGHLPVVKRLLAFHASVRRRGYHERTALHCATENGHLSVCRFLVSAKADLEEEDTFGNTPLICAAEKGYVELLKLFLSNKCDVNRMSHSAATALHYAAQHGDSVCCGILLQNGAEIDAQDIRRFTPLMMAAMNGHDDVVAMLIDWKCNVNMVAYNKRIALHLAAERGKLKCCSLLLNAGARIDSQDSLGCTPVHMAALKGHVQVMKYLITSGADLHKRPNNGHSLLHYAAAGGNEDCCQELITRGFDINAQNNDGITPLISSVHTKQVTTARLLLQAGCKTTYRGLHGMTALNEAVFYNHPLLLSMLLDYGADPDIEDDAGTLPLWFAVDQSSMENLKLLLRSNCRFNMRSALSNSCGPCNAIEHALHKQKLQVIVWLISTYCEEAANVLRSHLSESDKLASINKTFLSSVQEHIQAPQSLLCLCRKQIRAELGPGKIITNKIRQLKLPHVLKNFLDYSDLTE